MTYDVFEQVASDVQQLEIYEINHWRWQRPQQVVPQLKRLQICHAAIVAQTETVDVVKHAVTSYILTTLSNHSLSGM